MAVKTEKIQYNQLPRPTFRWMKVKNATTATQR